MDFPPRGGSRPGRGDDLEIDFEPLRPTRERPPARARPPPRQSRLGRRPRPPGQRGPAPPRKRRGPGSETVARVVWAVPWILFVVAIVAAGGVVFAIAIAGLACVGLAEFFRMTSDLHPFRLVAFAVAIGLV